MQKIGDLTNTADQYSEFTEGNEAQGISPTIIEGGWLNTIQREIVHVIEEAKIELNPKNDSQLLEAIKSLIITGTQSYKNLYPIGIVTWFSQNKNPNKLFPGTTWVYIGENKTIRLAKSDGSDVMKIGGADSVMLSMENLPAHSHSFSANTSIFDYGNKETTEFDYGNRQTDIKGQHTHSGVPSKDNPWEIGGSKWTRFNYQNLGTTDADGAHAHNVYIGAHKHVFTIGAHSHSISGVTTNTGSGASMSVTNSFIKLMGWYRSA